MALSSSSLLLLLVSLTLCAVSVVAISVDDTDSIAHHLSDFHSLVKTHQRQYVEDLKEYEKRFSIYLTNLDRLAEAQANDPRATYKMNKFFDLSKEEFQFQFKMSPMDITKLGEGPTPQKGISCLAKGVTADSAPANTAMPSSLPKAFTWQSQKDILTPVKNQEACGSCWAFSTVETIESLNAIAGNGLVELSPQELVDCSHSCSPEPPYGCVPNSGCEGGWPWNAYIDIIAMGGLETAKDYPYTAANGQCNFEKSKAVVNISNFTCISGPGPADETAMAAKLVADGPLSICLDATWFQFYYGGLSDPYLCPKTTLDHCVQIVGYGTETGWLGETEEYWIIRNSWGPDWGVEGGFMYLLKGQNVCGVANAVSQPII
eukprot:TRINITY_DN527_c0_g1_i1.p1 TRINITY_DN527_c0_g1~~TRINITY_DN527_c0_g1_i1.p1  ORF type:complete len:376 (+),score=101.72 TRINITY_DN527_c0_g1_i1:110-1237(+)